MNETPEIQNNDIQPLYQKLFTFYCEAILAQEFAPGTRIDSITEIMKKHGVSRETAKLVLKKLADEGLIIQKAGKGSFVAPLGPKRPVWGVIIPFVSDHHEKLIRHISLEAEAVGRTTEYYVDHNQWEEEIRLVGRLIRERYEAVIVAPTLDESRTAEFYRQLKSGGTLVALVDHTMAGSYFTYAIQSYDLGVKRAVRYLQSKTSGNLAFLKSDLWAGRNMIQEVMEQTFINFVQENQGEQRAVVLDRVSRLDPNLIRDEGIGGFFCCDDTDAVRVIGRLIEWGFRVPGDLSVISYGNTDLARFFTPKITSIDPHAEEMARRIAELIRAHGEGRSVRFEQYVIQPDLVVRET
jgi:DNA-binding LacI/PurR family transcriptional regulator